ENGDTARMGHEREHTGLVCLATGALRLRIPVTGLSLRKQTVLAHAELAVDVEDLRIGQEARQGGLRRVVVDGLSDEPRQLGRGQVLSIESHFGLLLFFSSR